MERIKELLKGSTILLGKAFKNDLIALSLATFFVVLFVFVLNKDESSGDEENDKKVEIKVVSKPSTVASPVSATKPVTSAVSKPGEAQSS